MRALSCLSLIATLAAAAPAVAQSRPHPALVELIPLVEVYDARRGQASGFDVAGIRCAAMVLAKDAFARANRRLPRADAAALEAAQDNLRASEIARRERGMGPGRATRSTREDAERATGLYLARFNDNVRAGRHPWDRDSLVARDVIYCGFLNERG